MHAAADEICINESNARNSFVHGLNAAAYENFEKYGYLTEVTYFPRLDQSSSEPLRFRCCAKGKILAVFVVKKASMI